MVAQYILNQPRNAEKIQLSLQKSFHRDLVRRVQYCATRSTTGRHFKPQP